MRDLYFCGDIHGELKNLKFTLINRYGIKNSDIVILGDLGIGFSGEFLEDYKSIEKDLENNDITLHSIRGNHDDPKYFNNPEFNPKLDRLKLLEDHKMYNICGKDIYTIGGAASTDITFRLEYNERSNKKIWWEDEYVIEKETLPTKADIIISHTAPINFSPVSARFPETPAEQYEKILQERRYLNKVLKLINANYWFYGHYHQSFSGDYNGLLWRGLDISEIYLFNTSD